jgi:hypothetical protein
VPHVSDRAKLPARESALTVGRRRPKPPEPATLHGSIMGLHRHAGNRAVTGLLQVQRDVGWKKDASEEGYAWNKGERAVGKIRRIPLQDIQAGVQKEKGLEYFARDPKDKTKWIKKTEGTQIDELSPESATGRAIVLVPEGLDATQPIEVVVFLHGFTEHTGRPFAGWRALSNPSPGKGPKATKAQQKQAKALEPFRQGIDEKDTAPVRDVALDQAEAQLEESGQTQLVIVLPQGGLHSQFGTEGDRNFDSATYVKEIVTRLGTESAWMDPQKKPVDAPKVTRVSMAGHSGAGATLANMANESVRQWKAATSPPPKGGKKPKDDKTPKEEEKPKSSAIDGDLVIFDAMNSSGDIGAFKAWARMRLKIDFDALMAEPDDKKKLEYLRTAPKLRGFFTSIYHAAYKELDDDIADWFDEGKHAKKLGKIAGCLRANFKNTPVALEHEELMRGAKAGKDREKGKGGILEAIGALHPPAIDSVDKCPPMPKRLS